MAYLHNLPGFAGASDAVPETAEGSLVLKKMEDLKLGWLPVTGPDASPVGVVRQSAVLAGLVLELNRRLQQ